MIVFWLILIMVFTAGFIFTAINSNESLPIIGCFFGLVISIFCFGITYANRIAVNQMKVLSAANIEYIDKDSVYNMSKAELDKCYSISTLDGTFYYKFEKEETK